MKLILPGCNRDSADSNRIKCYRQSGFLGCINVVQLLVCLALIQAPDRMVDDPCKVNLLLYLLPTLFKTGTLSFQLTNSWNIVFWFLFSLPLLCSSGSKFYPADLSQLLATIKIYSLHFSLTTLLLMHFLSSQSISYNVFLTLGLIFFVCWEKSV